MADVDRIRAAVLDWYARQGRDLPWRQTRDPYAVLVAEVMLQQTQVDRVIPKWHAWLARFPTLFELAAASRADAIRAWEGLGYNLRAVRLHAIACQTVAEFGGQLPSTVAGLLSLKGIGPYTAGAVACFAFEQPAATVDTNIRRVLSRVFGVEPARADSVAERVLPAGQAYAWNQALMDLGATVCRARRPLCRVCPLGDECAGPQAEHTSKRPAATFAGSRRFHRGRIVDALRRADAVATSELGAPELIERLTAEGLVEVDSAGYARLAGNNQRA